MNRAFFVLLFLLCFNESYAWGFYGHQQINKHAVFLLPPSMLVFFKPHLDYLIEHAVDPDKRRYAVLQEGPRHYIDLDNYGAYPFDSLPRRWNDAVMKYGIDSLQSRGIVPWWIQTMLLRLTKSFAEKNTTAILKNAAELGHYIADSHVPLHTSSNHDGQHTGQKGIHGFWESRIPELLAANNWDFLIGKAEYIPQVGEFVWARILESAHATDSVLRFERELSARFPGDQKFSFEERNGIIVRQYSSAYTTVYDQMMGGMVERRMRASIYSVACFWYTAWINAGQPDLSQLPSTPDNEDDRKELQELNRAWKEKKSRVREHE